MVDLPRLWLVRHGETEWAREGRHTSRTDVTLTEAGRAEARALASVLGSHSFERIVSSPRSRARETARLAGFGDRLEIDDDLAEWDYGTDEGLTTAEIRERTRGWTIWDQGPHGGETAAQVAARADRIVARARQIGGDTLAFAHGHILRVVAARWLGQPPSSGRFYLLSVSTLSVLGWEHGEPVIERWNEAAAGGAASGKPALGEVAGGEPPG